MRRVVLGTLLAALVALSGTPTALHAKPPPHRAPEASTDARPGAGASDVARRAKKPAPAKATPTFLWKVRSETATVYLLGSIHVASVDMFPLDARIERAFAAADTLVLEAPLDPVSMHRGQQALRAAAAYTPPDGLAQHLDADTRDKLAQVLAELGLPAAVIATLRPWMVSLTLSLAQLDRLGYRTDLGIDMHFHERASRAGAEHKRIGALETLEEQIAIMRDMPQDTQVMMLQQTLAELHFTDSLMTQSVAAWRRGDADTIERLMVEPARNRYPHVHRRLLLERNVRMADAIAEHLRGAGTVFVVVGSAHLVGEGSVLSLLRAGGYRPVQQ